MQSETLRTVWILAHSGQSSLPKDYLKLRASTWIEELEAIKSSLNLVQLGHMVYGISLFISNQTDSVYSNCVQTLKTLNNRYHGAEEHSMSITKRRKSMHHDSYSMAEKDQIIYSIDLFNWPPTDLAAMGKRVIELSVQGPPKEASAEKLSSPSLEANNSIFSVTDNLLDTFHPLGDDDEVPENLFALMDEVLPQPDVLDELAQDYTVAFDMPDWDDEPVVDRPSTPVNENQPPLYTPENTPHRKVRVVKPKADVHVVLTDTKIESTFENYEHWAREQGRKRKWKTDWFKFFNVRRPPSQDLNLDQDQDQDLNLEMDHEPNSEFPSDPQAGIDSELDLPMLDDENEMLVDDIRVDWRTDSDNPTDESSYGHHVDLERLERGLGDKVFLPVQGDEVIEEEILALVAEHGGKATLEEILPNAARSKASCFYSLLVLAATGRVGAKQEQSYGSVVITSSFRAF